MTSPASRVEVQKMAYELGIDPGSLDYLLELPADELATLRHGVSRALFHANEHRVKPLGALAKRVPAALSAKVAQAALGPLLCGRVASVMDARTAIGLAGHFSPEFLAQVSVAIDPGRSAEIIAGLDDDLVVAVGKRLIADGEYMVLARFISVVTDAVVRPLVDVADGAQLLDVALYAEDHGRIDAFLPQIDDAKLASVIQAATTSDARADEAVSLITLLGTESQHRLAGLAAGLGAEVTDAVVRAIIRLEVWAALLPVVGALTPDEIAGLINVPALLDATQLDELIAEVRDAGEELPFRVLLDVLEVVDADHLAVLPQLTQLDAPATLAWATASTGLGEAEILEAIACVRAGEPLPDTTRATLAAS